MDNSSKQDPDRTHLDRITQRAYALARRQGNRQIGTQHVLQMLSESGSHNVTRLFQILGLDSDTIQQEISRTKRPRDDYVGPLRLDRVLAKFGLPPLRLPSQLEFTPLATQAINQSYEHAKSRHDEAVLPEHILRAILREPSSVGTQVLQNVRHGGLKLIRADAEALFPAGSHAPGPADDRKIDLNANELFDQMQTSVIDQPGALRSLATAVVLHQAGLQLDRFRKLNILLIGPTGVGKTLAIETLARLLHVKVGVLNCATTTAPGYVGGDIESAFWDLYIKSNKDIVLTERGIVFLDEIDKLAVPVDSHDHAGKMGRSVQQALLRVLEGTELRASPSGAQRSSLEESVAIRTDRILFVAAGAFSGIENILKNRHQKSGVFASQLLRHEEEDLLTFGMLPELVGRLPFLAVFHPLRQASLRSILDLPNGSPLAVYEHFFKTLGVELYLEDGVKEHLASLAERRGLGARPLQGLVHQLLEPHVFCTPDSGELSLSTKDAISLLGE